MTPEERIAELEANCKAMTAEIEKLKAELAEKNETVWTPKFDDSYMYIDSFGCTYATYLENMSLEKQRIDFNNVYQLNDKTREHLKWYVNNVLRVQNKLMQLHELLCPDYFPDWNNNTDNKWYVSYNYKIHRFRYSSCSFTSTIIIYFTEEAAEKACEILNREKFMMENISENK